MSPRRLRRLAAFLVAALLAVAALPAAAGATLSTGRSGWQWSSPSPQGESLADVAFAGDVGYAVGARGTLLRSADGGLTWTGLPAPTRQDLTRVVTVGGGFAASGACAVRRSDDAGTTVRTIDIGGGDDGCGTSVVAPAFSDPANGLLLLANGLVLGTADGGASFSRRTPVPGAAADLVATGPATAVAISGSAIYRTVDGAGSWTLAGNIPGWTLRSLHFPTATVGYAVGDGGIVMKSVDGGASWQLGPGPGVALGRIRCASADLCLAVTASGSALARTANGGLTWSQVAPFGGLLRAVAFASPTRAVAVGSGGGTVVSDDGGVTWREIGGRPVAGVAPRSVAARPGGFAYAVGSTGIALTTDAGERWGTVAIPSPLPVLTAAFADPRTGYAMDAGGTLRRTTDGGTSWQVLDPGAVAGSLHEIVPLSNGRVLLVRRGGVARSVDGGDTFVPVRDRALRASGILRGRIVGALGRGSRAFVIGTRGIVRSTDGGGRWLRARLPWAGGRPVTIRTGDCAVPATCWIVSTAGRVYRTANLGRRWRDVTAAVGAPRRRIAAVAAAGGREAFLMLDQETPSEPDAGVVLHTADDGRTWAQQVVGRPAPASIDAVPGRAWVLDGAGSVLTTATGGSTGTPSVLRLRAARTVLRRPATVTLTGRLRGARGGERVTVWAGRLRPRAVTVASAGTFTIRVRVRATTAFVAQWAGDGVRDGAGTPPLTIRVRR